jgi:NADH dehydrogenase [ubiquinone] 1 alpha subcomplex assembly factor 7
VNPLAALLRRRIEADGPITVADYMAEALGHPSHGYYTRRDPLGRAGDFTTAPEISQVFGELIGLWWSVVWEAMDRPDPVNLVELGPGRGTLMADALRAIAGVRPQFAAAARLRLVETSPVLRRRQRQTLAAAHPEIPSFWYRRIADLPDGPMLAVANEFFDVLPVHQLLRAGDGWRERRVGMTADGQEFCFVDALAADPSLIETLPTSLADAVEGSLVELCPAAEACGEAIVGRLTRFGGAALVIDYGHRSSGIGDTVQAVRGHAYAKVLDSPGEADLTHHVDFEALVRAVTVGGARTYGPVPQTVFLGRLGIAQRADKLIREASPDQAKDIRSGVHRLIHPREMGELFKVLAIAAPDLPSPPGFAPDGP